MLQTASEGPCLWQPAATTEMPSNSDYSFDRRAEIGRRSDNRELGAQITEAAYQILTVDTDSSSKLADEADPRRVTPCARMHR